MANPPPYFRLGMTNGSGQGSGSTEQTPIDLYQQGYDQGVVDGNPIGGSGAAGLLDAPTGDLTFGTVGPGDTKTLNFTGTGGEFYSGRLVFSTPGADAAYFRITEVGGDTRDTPFNCASGDYIIAFDEGANLDVVFDVLYKDGAQQTMTVTVYDVDGSVVDTISASATVQDPVLAAVIASGGAIGLWTPFLSSAGLGALANGDVVMAEKTAIQAPDTDLDAVLPGAPTNWSLQDSDPCGNSELLSWSLKTDYRGPAYPSTPTHYAGLAAYTGGTAYSGIVFIKIPEGAFPDDFAASHLRFVNLGGLPSGIDRAAGYTVQFGNNPFNQAAAVTAAGSNGAAVTPSAIADKWLSIAWSGNPGTGACEVYVSEVGQTFKAVAESSGVGWGGTVGPGIALFDDCKNPAAVDFDNVQVAGLALFNTQKTDAELAAIHDAAQT